MEVFGACTEYVCMYIVCIDVQAQPTKQFILRGLFFSCPFRLSSFFAFSFLFFFFKNPFTLGKVKYTERRGPRNSEGGGVKLVEFLRTHLGSVSKAIGEFLYTSEVTIGRDEAWGLLVVRSMRIYEMVYEFTRWYKNLRDGIRIYETVYEFIKWYANLQGYIRVYKMVYEFINKMVHEFIKWYMKLQDKTQIYEDIYEFTR